eukprot:jgi/Chlat1/7162/Chrsp57S06817
MLGMFARRRPDVHSLQGADKGQYERVSTSTTSFNVGSSGSKAGASLLTLAAATMVVAGVQFGWALQLSLLTPYVQELGIPHKWTSFIWLCGPMTGIVVQPYVGVWSDSSRHRWGRRRPFILSGAVMVLSAVLLIAYSADIGYALGDDVDQNRRPWAILLFILGFWLLDVANNTIQGPSRALIADLSGDEGQELGNALYSAWMGLGNILGYSAGATSRWHEWFPRLQTASCTVACADLKGAFIAATVFLAVSTGVSICSANETPLPELLAHKSEEEADEEAELRASELPALFVRGGTIQERFNRMLKRMNLSPAMRACLIVQGLTWFGWFPFLLFDTDWMGRHVFGGQPASDSHDGPAQAARRAAAYRAGVHAGSLGLLLNSVAALVFSLFLKPICARFGNRLVWAFGNLLYGVLLACTLLVAQRDGSPASALAKVLAVTIFAFLGISWAITMVVPYALTAEYTAESGGGQGLAMGVLNLAIVFPQVLVSMYAGPMDSLFGGANEPSFVLASLWGFAAAAAAAYLLPSPKQGSLKQVDGLTISNHRRTNTTQYSHNNSYIQVHSAHVVHVQKVQ